MSYSYINREYIKNKPQFWLCLPYPRRSSIRKLTEIYNVDLKLSLGKVHELSFDIPVMIERNNELIKNPLIEQFNGFYQVRMEWNGMTEYFVYTVGNRKINNSGQVLSYKLYSSAYLLSKKMIRAYEETSKNLSYHANLFLEQTNWSLDYVDVDFDLMYRQIEQSEATSLQCLYDLAETFNAIIKFNTVDQKVSFYKPENVGLNKGMTFKTGIFIESLGYEINFDEIVTRLSVYGSDELEFRRLSPTGSNYIEDLSWFMYPFECDENYNVITHSKWMTDALCIAYTKYQKKLEAIGNTFETLTKNKTKKDDEIIQLESELSSLQMAMNQIENELWVINKTYLDQAPNRNDWKTKIAQKEAKQLEINAKNTEIETAKTELVNIELQLFNLRVDVQVENNFTADEIIEMNEFIHHKTYTNSSITDDEDLFKDGIDAFKKVNQPPITISLDLVNFLNDVEFEKIHNRIALGDTVKIKSEEIDVYVSLKIIEIGYNHSNDGISLTISNEEDLRDDMAKLVDKIYTSSNTSTQVNIDKYKWNLGETANDNVTKILNSSWDSAKNAIVGGHENTTVVDKYGLKSIDSDDPNNFLFINNAIFGITADGLNSISVAIDKNGVHAERLVGKIILGNTLWIEDDLGVVEIKNGLQTIYDADGNPRVYLGRYPDADNANNYKYGLRVIDGAFDIRTSTNTNRGIAIDGTGIRAYNNNGAMTFEVDAATGKVSIIGDMSIKTHANDYKGVSIDGNGIHIYDTNGALAFDADNNGNVFFAGKLQNATGTVNNLGGTFNGTVTGTLSANTVKSINIDASQITTGTLNASLIGADTIDASKLNVNKLSAITADLGTVTSGTISGTTITGNNISGGTITGTTINGTTITGGTIDGVSITTDQYVVVGKRLYFGGTQSFDLIDTSNGNMSFYAWNGFDFWGTDISFNGDTIVTSRTKGLTLGYSTETIPKRLYLTFNGVDVAYAELVDV